MKKSNVFVGGALVLLTALNVGYRVVRDRSRSRPLWDFPLGEHFPPAKLRPLTFAEHSNGNSLPSACRVMVFLDVHCPNCEAAKAREAALPTSLALPVVWIATHDDSATAAFGAGLGAKSLLMYGDSAALSPVIVRAAPIGFLVDARNVVKIIVPYDGSASEHRGLRRYC